jgi:SPP1 family predicted phage head-tail adaptor
MAQKRQINSGLLRHTVLLQQDQGSTRGNFGNPVPRWVTIRTAWASIEPISGRELWQGMQIRPDVTHGLVLRAAPSKAVGPAMRILFGPGTWQANNDLSVAFPTNCRVFEIKESLNVEEQGRKLIVQAIEQVT